jgi:hypothetical protein
MNRSLSTSSDAFSKHLYLDILLLIIFAIGGLVKENALRCSANGLSATVLPSIEHYR